MLTADYFDGRSTRVRVVRLEVAGEDLLITGEDLDLRIPFSEVIVDAVHPKTIFAPPGVAHVFINISDQEELMLIAYAGNIYDPADTVPYNLVD